MKLFSKLNKYYLYLNALNYHLKSIKYNELRKNLKLHLTWLNLRKEV